MPSDPTSSGSRTRAAIFEASEALPNVHRSACSASAAAGIVLHHISTLSAASGASTAHMTAGRHSEKAQEPLTAAPDGQLLRVVT